MINTKKLLIYTTVFNVFSDSSKIQFILKILQKKNPMLKQKYVKEN
jgi:hypothetical protein